LGDLFTNASGQPAIIVTFGWFFLLSKNFSAEIEFHQIDPWLVLWILACDSSLVRLTMASSSSLTRNSIASLQVVQNRKSKQGANPTIFKFTATTPAL
jgi:hypothetical protein